MIDWQAGPFTAKLDPVNGFLRYLSASGVELLRGICVAVRDPDWGTVAPQIRDWLVDGDRITFTAECRAEPIDFVWHGVIEVVGDTLRYTLDGEARSTFRRNRIGFCVLHPMELAGEACLIEYVDGNFHLGHFPEFVSPWQPFVDIRRIRHEALPGVLCDVWCEGDTFEMEDQRNWTDASFKTYCTPLELPFPVEVAKGTRIRQSVTVTLSGETTHGTPSTLLARRHDATITVSQAPTLSLPAIGLGYAPGTHPEAIHALQPTHLRVDLHLSDPDWRDALAAADALGYPLELAVIDSPDIEPCLPPIASPIARVLLFDADRRATSPDTIARWLPIIRKLGVPLAGGTDAYFAELNREPPPLDHLDSLTFSINPQVHAFDDASLVETIAAQEVVVQCAKQLGEGRPVGISTLTLLPRFNPNATSGAAQAPGTDPRQATDFCAAWTVGSLNALTRAGLDSLTLYETVGPRGVVEFRVYDVLAAVAGSTAVYEALSDQPLVAEALVVERDRGPLALVANLTAAPRSVRLEPAGRTVELGPYEVARVALR